MRTNYATNPTLASNQTGWVSSGTATVTRQADTDFTAGFCVEVTSAVTNGGLEAKGQVWPASDGDTVTVGFTEKTVSGNTGWTVRQRGYSADGSSGGSLATIGTFTAQATATRHVFTFNLANYAGYARLAIYVVPTSASSGVVRISDLTFERGTTVGTWFTAAKERARALLQSTFQLRPGV